MAANRPLVLVLDFDGTVTEKDLGDGLCERFAPPAWRDLDVLWMRNQITLPDAQRQMWAMVRAERAEALAYAREIGHERPGLDALLARVAACGGESWLASGGFDFYIEAILGERLSRFQRSYYNQTTFTERGVDLAFPHTALACDRCAVCKGKVCDLARATGAEVLFAGDGTSDRCVIGRADTIFAVEGSHLAQHCDANGAAYRSFRAFDELVRP
jgi:2-hydroxy-3-keto-5-methylthiopentenyl-1-phosphate phosphatase